MGIYNSSINLGVFNNNDGFTLSGGGSSLRLSSGNIILSGNLSYITNLVTGLFYSSSNPNQYATSGDLLSTGSAISAWTGDTPNIFAPLTHVHNYVTGLSVTGATAVTGLINFTGIGGLIVVVSGQTISFSGGAGGGTTNNTYLNGVTGVSVSGSVPITGNVILSGIGGLNVILSGQSVLFSGGAAGGTTETASNLGGGSGVYSTKVVNDLRFKSLIGGSGIQITGDNNSLTIIVTGIAGATGASVPTDISSITGCRNTQFGIVIDAGSSTITTGFKGYTRIPRAMTILGWEIVGNVSGTISFDIWKTEFAGYPPTISNTIVGAIPPQLNNKLTASTGVVTGWITGCTMGDYIAFTVNSGVSGVNRVNLSVYGVSL